MGKAGNAGQETSKQGCERNDGGAGGWGSLRDYFCCSQSQFIWSERERKKKKKKGQTSWYQKEKEKKRSLQLNILKNPFSLLGTKSTIDENPFFIDFDFYILYITFQVIDT